MSFQNRFMGRRVLVTGHTGFKGSWLCIWLLQLGAEVCGYSDGVPTSPSLFEASGLADRIDHVVGDIRDRSRFGDQVRAVRPDFVFHLAAQAIVSTSYREPVETFSTNVVGTACVLDALRDIDWPCIVLVVTSDKCYENVEQPWGYREIDPLGGRDVYSASKGAAEIVAHSYYHSFFKVGSSKVRITTARAGNVLGGGDWAADRIVADCIRAWTKGEIVELRRPSATRPWQHVLEPLGGYLALAAAVSSNADLNGESFNFGPRAEQNRTVLELLRDLAAEWGMDDLSRAYSALPDPPFHEAGLLKLNCDKALMHLQWEATLSYSECIEMTGGWYRDVLKGGEHAMMATLSQIERYRSLSENRGRAWAQRSR